MNTHTDTHTPTPIGLAAWREVITLLRKASERGYAQSVEVPTFAMVALNAYLLAAEANFLLPETGGFFPDVELTEATARLDAAGLIRTAASLTLDHGLDEFPPGASPVIMRLVMLAAEVSR